MKKNKGLTLFISIVVLFVITTIVIGFVLIGSPVNQRLKRLDDQRSNDLSSLESELISYWNQYQDLPEDLNALEDRLYREDVLQDPETGTMYEYAKVSQDAFELCANFSVEKTNDRPYLNNKYDYTTRSGSYYEHVAGRVCYETTFDLAAYKKMRENNNLPLDIPVRAY